MTGLADDWERFIKKKGPDGLFVPNPRVHFTALDEPLKKIYSSHAAILKNSKTKPAQSPTDIEACLAAFDRFQTAAFK